VRLVVASRDRFVLGSTRCPSLGKQLGDLDEVVLETGRADELQQPSWLVRWVPEGVRDTAGLVDIALSPSLRDLVAHADADAALENIGELVLHRVRVGQNKPPTLDWVLDNGEAAAGQVAPDLEIDPQALPLDRPALAGPYDQQPAFLRFHHPTSRGFGVSLLYPDCRF
jgi:hypothetical protein